jgi:hypothetical protein
MLFSSKIVFARSDVYKTDFLAKHFAFSIVFFILYFPLPAALSFSAQFGIFLEKNKRSLVHIDSIFQLNSVLLYMYA